MKAYVTLLMFLVLAAGALSPAAAQPAAASPLAAPSAAGGCTMTAYPPFLDQRLISGVLTTAVVGRVRVECPSTQASINVTVSIARVGGSVRHLSSGCGSDASFCEVETWTRYTSGTWFVAGQSYSASPTTARSVNVQL